MKTMTKRTDIHRPSEIKPEDYDFVTCIYLGCKEMDPSEALQNAANLEFFREHMDRTGGRYSQHSHGGSCMVCGAHALYLGVFYHPTTNSYIKMGEECTRKLEMGDVEGFNPLRRAVANARQAKAGKKKAETILADEGLERA